MFLFYLLSNARTEAPTTFGASSSTTGGAGRGAGRPVGGGSRLGGQNRGRSPPRNRGASPPRSRGASPPQRRILAGAKPERARSGGSPPRQQSAKLETGTKRERMPSSSPYKNAEGIELDLGGTEPATSRGAGVKRPKFNRKEIDVQYCLDDDEGGRLGRTLEPVFNLVLHRRRTRVCQIV